MELKGTGFLLRKWRNGDEISLQKYANNKNVSRFLFDRFPYPYTMYDAERWVSIQSGQHPVKNFVIAIDGEVAGAIEFKTGEDVYRKSAIMGYWLGEPFWGRGIMTEAVNLIIKYAFENFDLIRIQASVNNNNPASMQVLEKAGFKKEGILKNAIFKDEVTMDEHIYAILRH